MKILINYKRADACYYFRSFLPGTQLSLMGHEVKHINIEHQLHCQYCGQKSGMQEVQFSFPGDEYHCRVCKTILLRDINQWKKNIFELNDWCDISVFQRVTEKEHLDLMRAVKSQGKKIYSEADDNYFDIPLRNSGRAYYLPKKEIIEEMFKLSDGVTVTTDALKEYYSYLNKNIQVIPNAFDVEMFDVTPPIQQLYICNGARNQITVDQFNEARKDKKFVCWAGSPTHEEDLEIVLKPLKKLIERENVIVGMGAYVHGYMLKEYPKDNLFCFGVVPSQGWISMLQFLKPDVWIAPVVKNEFNRGKSNIKLLESSLMGSVFVGTDFDTYSGYGFDCFLTENTEYDWWRNLRYAVSVDPEEKQKMIETNSSLVREKYDIQITAKEWDRFYSTGVAT